MNKEDTKQTILGFTEFFKGITGNQDLKIPDDIAKEYGIEAALEREPCDDAISRDKAIVQLSHLLSDWDDDWNVAIRKCIETIKIVPPAAPHYTDAEIQKMQELEQAQLEKVYELGKAALDEAFEVDTKEYGRIEVVGVDAIDSLLSVNPAEKQEPCENPHIYECSCGYGWDKNKVVRHHFCPNCGRKVQEVEE